MNSRTLSLLALVLVPAWAAACADPPPPDVPAQPTADPVTTATAQAAPPPPAPPPAPEPPPKPGKEKIVGKWQFAFEGEPLAKAEADAKKKFPKDKDAAKREAMIKQVGEAAAGEWIEFTDGHYVSHTTVKGKDKVVLKIKYEIAKDETAKISMKPVGKDEISKKEMKDEVSVAFTDDNTITMMDPKKKITLIFKRK